MINVTKPRTVSFEDALRNLAVKLTGQPANTLPRTQEGIVQYMAENVPSVDEMVEDVAQKVVTCLTQAAPADGGTDEPTANEQISPDNTEQPEASAEDAHGKGGRESRNSK